MAKKVFSSNILLKNLPKDVDNLTETLMQLRPLPAEIKSFGRRRALLIYSNDSEAQIALSQLHGLTMQEREIKASLFFTDVRQEFQERCTNATESQNALNEMSSFTSQSLTISFKQRRNKPKAVQTNMVVAGVTAKPAVSNYVRRLYACNSQFDFEQPPPPYLQYAYPRITQAILDSIGIALMSNTCFYTQVLHLMNRMNLEPPFEPRKHKILPNGEPCEAATLTKNVVVMRNKISETITSPRRLSAVIKQPEVVDESELETSGEEFDKIRCKLLVATTKRTRALNKEQYKKKARLLVQASMSKISAKSKTSKESSLQSVKDAFEAPIAGLNVTKIALNLTPKYKTILEPIVTKAEENATLTSSASMSAFVPGRDYSKGRLSLEQLRKLPVFKNYSEGEPSSKLYIKNLAKGVCVEDLRALYTPFVSSEQLDVKVMQQGRMKGQAFIVFKKISEADYESVVGLALRETNGFILKQKPLVVCFGRK